jgi:hypothetical protein
MKSENETFRPMIDSGVTSASEGVYSSADSVKENVFGRRSFVKRLVVGSAMLAPLGVALASEQKSPQSGTITDSDADILRFLAAAEIIETDLWQQYADFVLVDSPFTRALSTIDDNMGTYTVQNTNDEFSHQDFLNAFLVKNHRQPVDLEPFRTLPGSPVAPTKIKRLTNLQHLNVDTSWFVRYRSHENPDFVDSFPQAVNIMNRPSIPVKDQSLYTANQIQAIANTAAFHFATIEQGGSSLYDALSQNCTTLLALRILTSIGGSEVVHFAIWNDKAGDAPPVDSGDGLVFPDLNLNPATTTSMVMPRPCKFIDGKLPLCSIIRPTSLRLAGAMAAVRGLTASGLFRGQSSEFLSMITDLAQAADRARRDD